jgi:DNA-binding XRE family transcriptional regulator
MHRFAAAGAALPSCARRPSGGLTTFVEFDMVLLAQSGQHRQSMPRDAVVSFSSNLRRLRRELGITQEELGARAHVQMADISRYEAGHRDPRLTTVARLAEALEVSVSELLRADAE